MKNVGQIDRVIRVIAGLALLSLLFIVPDARRWFGLIGLVPLLTALVGYCPLYSVIGVSSCPASGKK